MATKIADNEIVTTTIQLTICIIRDAISSPWRGPRDRAREYIIHKIIDGLDTDTTLKLAEYEKQEDPCQ